MSHLHTSILGPTGLHFNRTPSGHRAAQASCGCHLPVSEAAGLLFAAISLQLLDAYHPRFQVRWQRPRARRCWNLHRNVQTPHSCRNWTTVFARASSPFWNIFVSSSAVFAELASNIPNLSDAFQPDANRLRCRHPYTQFCTLLTMNCTVIYLPPSQLSCFLCYSDTWCGPAATGLTKTRNDPLCKCHETGSIVSLAIFSAHRSHFSVIPALSDSKTSLDPCVPRRKKTFVLDLPRSAFEKQVHHILAFSIANTEKHPLPSIRSAPIQEKSWIISSGFVCLCTCQNLLVPAEDAAHSPV